MWGIDNREMMGCSVRRNPKTSYWRCWIFDDWWLCGEHPNTAYLYNHIFEKEYFYHQYQWYISNYNQSLVTHSTAAFVQFIILQPTTKVPVWVSRWDCWYSRQNHFQLFCDLDDIATFVPIWYNSPPRLRNVRPIHQLVCPSRFYWRSPRILIYQARELWSCPLFDFYLLRVQEPQGKSNSAR